jgi:hypothetical protein
MRPKPFAVGDRVAVHGYDASGIFCNGFRGEVRGIDGPAVRVALDKNRGNVLVGSTQCRRLRKKS